MKTYGAAKKGLKRVRISGEEMDKRKRARAAIVKISSAKTLRNEVRKQILKSQEVKRVFTNNQVSVSSTGASTDYINIIPNIAQGVADNQRIGNNVTTRSMKLRLVISPAESAALAWAAKRYRVMVLSLRNNQTVTATMANDLFDAGGFAVGNTGVPVDALYDVNPDTWITHYDLITYPKMIMDNGTTAQQYPLNDCSQHVLDIDCTKYIKKRLVYEDATTSCTNANLFLFVMAITANAYQPATGVGVYDYAVYYDYTDA